ncbi:MAG: hypothetical protein EAZ08_07965 [Cytophagales bacterium]|nr:MAG: hypothetical protein EAZ08_07965 [Cytophagales bacterium]
MKKSIFITLFFLAVVALSSSFAQDMTTWTWDTYKMKFDVPSNFKVTKNTADAFVASNGKITLSMYPRKGQNLNYAKMQAAVLNWASSSNLDSDSGAQYVEDLNGYWGCYVEGVAKGFPTTALLLIDPDYTDISLYVWISYAASEEDTAAAMLQSFTLN